MKRDSRPSRAPASVYGLGSDSTLLRVIGIVLLSYVLEGPLRLGLTVAGVPMLLYLRDAVMLGVIALALFLRRGRTSVAPGVIAAVIGCHLAVGVLSLPSRWQPLMGAKVFIPLLFGVASAPLVARHPEKLLRFSRFTLGITLLGLFGNFFIQYPWIGMQYETSLGAVEASRAWESAGVSRLPGFTRASYAAATIIALTLIPLLASQAKRSVKCAALLLSFLGIVLTTTKGTWTGLACYLVLEMLWRIGRSRLWACGLVLLAILCLALPLGALVANPSVADAPAWQQSFFERIQDMWPRTLALLDDPGAVLWGRGLGGVGVAQILFEGKNPSAADNLMLYVLVTFGIFGLAYVAALVTAGIRYAETCRTPLLAAAVRGWLAILFSVGLTTNMLEDTATEIALGIVLGLVFEAYRAAPPVTFAAHWARRAPLPDGSSASLA